MKNVGEIIDDVKIIKYLGADSNHVKHFEVECIVCGKKKYIQLSRLNSHTCTKHGNKSCGIYKKEYDENIGLSINDYTIIERIDIDENGNRYLAKCNICGTEFETYISNFKRRYGTKHLHCRYHIKKDENYKRFSKIYSCMRYRTTNPKYTEYEYYGGRGINSDYFKDFMVFYKDMYESYIDHVQKYGEKDTTLDRIDVNGNYTKENCRWTTYKEQANNKRAKNV